MTAILDFYRTDQKKGVDSLHQELVVDQKDGLVFLLLNEELVVVLVL
jgi:hypothetical protein